MVKTIEVGLGSMENHNLMVTMIEVGLGSMGLC